MPDTPAFEVIVPIYRSRRVLGPFLAGIGPGVDVTLVDNAYGEDDLADLLSGLSNVRVRDAGGNIGFSAAANLGAESSDAEYLIFMNPDTRPSERSLRRMVEFLQEHPQVAACGAAGDGTAGGGAQPTMPRVIAHSLGLHRVLPRAGVYWTIEDTERIAVEWISGSCLAIRRSAFMAAGRFDEAYFVYMSDIELGSRLVRIGSVQMLLGDVVVPHDDGGSSDLPEVWVWRRRGAAWARFLRRTRRLPAALGLSVIVGAGYALRVVGYRLAGRRLRAVEMRSYLDAFLAEWIHPEPTPHRPHT